MSEQYTHALLRTVVGQMCQSLGWTALQSGACDVLVDILKGYLHTVAKTTAAYSIHANRTEPNLADLALAFGDLGINLSEVSEFCREVESNPCVHTVPKYPFPKKSSHVCLGGGPPRAGARGARSTSFSSDEDSDEGYIPSYLPPLPQKGEDGNDEDNESGIHVPSDDEAMDVITTLPPDPSKGLPSRIFRRALSSDMSEEGEARSRRNSLSDMFPPLGGEEREPNPVQAMSSLAVVSLRPTLSTTPSTSSSLLATPTTFSTAAAPLPVAPVPVAPPPLGTPSTRAVVSVVPAAKSPGPSGGDGGDGDGSDVSDDVSDDDDVDVEANDDDDGDDRHSGKLKAPKSLTSGTRSVTPIIHPTLLTVPSKPEITPGKAPMISGKAPKIPGKAPSLDVVQRASSVHTPVVVSPVKAPSSSSSSSHTSPKAKPTAVPLVPWLPPVTASPHPDHTPTPPSIHRTAGKGTIHTAATPPETSFASPYKVHRNVGGTSLQPQARDPGTLGVKDTPVRTGGKLMAHEKREREVSPGAGATLDQLNPPASAEAQGFDDDLDVSSSEDSLPDSVAPAQPVVSTPIGPPGGASTHVEPPGRASAHVEPSRGTQLSRKKMREEESEEEEEDDDDDDDVAGDSGEEETRGGHGGKVKLHMHPTEDWERGEVIKASPLCDEEGWPFDLPKVADESNSSAWEVLSSLEEDEELSVGEEPLPPIPQVQAKATPAVESEPLSLVVRVNRKLLVKQKPAIPAAPPLQQTNVGHVPLRPGSSLVRLGEEELGSLVVSINKRLLEGRKASSPVHQRGMEERPSVVLVKSEKKTAKPSRKRELDVSEISLFGKEPKKIKVIPQPSSSSGSSSDGEGTQPTHVFHEPHPKERKRVELKVKLKLDKAVVKTSTSSPLKPEKKPLPPSKGSSQKTKSKKSKPHQLPLVIPATAPVVLLPSLPPPTAVAMGSDYICPQCKQHDDGTPMICCDSCDEWLHWRCVGITQPPPEQVPWFCPSCQLKNLKKSKKKKKH